MLSGSVLNGVIIFALSNGLQLLDYLCLLDVISSTEFPMLYGVLSFACVRIYDMIDLDI